MKLALTPISFPSRRGMAIGPPFGAIIYLISIGLVAAATISVFFGLGFYLLAQRPAAGAYSQARPASGSVTTASVGTARPRPAPTTAVAVPSVHDTGEEGKETPIAAGSGPPAIVGTVPSGKPQRTNLSASVVAAMGRPPPPETSTPQPVEKLPAAPPALTQPTSPHFPAAEIAAFLAQGKAAFRKGDIPAARLFYQRAFEAGDGRGAMGMGATYDPAFLRLRPLRILYGDPPEARAWYLHALALGAAGAERRLINLQARAPR